MISMFHYSLHSSDGIGKERTTGIPLTLDIIKKIWFLHKEMSHIEFSKLAIFVSHKVDIGIHNVAN